MKSVIGKTGRYVELTAKEVMSNCPSLLVHNPMLRNVIKNNSGDDVIVRLLLAAIEAGSRESKWMIK